MVDVGQKIVVSHTLSHWLLVDEVAHASDGAEMGVLLEIVEVGVGVELPSSLGMTATDT